MTAQTFKAFVKIKRLMSGLDVANATRHGKRIGNVAHVDLSRSHLNRHWAYSAGNLRRATEAPDLHTMIEARREDRGAKQPASTPTVATEVLISTTRDAFLDENGQIDTQRAYEWADEMLTQIEAKWPGMTCAARLDLDEQSPHFSAFLVPVHMKGPNKKRNDVSEEAHAARKPRASKAVVSHNSVFGGPKDFSAHQVWAQEVNAAFFSPLGLTLEPSTPKAESGAKYIPPRLWRMMQQQIAALKDEATQEALSEAVEKVRQITDDATAEATQIKAEAEAERDAARAAAAEARQAAENARDEAKALLDVVKAAKPLEPLHDAYQSLLDGANLTPQQALAAENAAAQDQKWLAVEVFNRENGFDRPDRDAAVWLAHPEVAAEVRARRPDPVVLDLLEPASASIGFRARFFAAFGHVRDLVMTAVKTVIDRRAASVQQDARARMADPDFRASADLGRRLFNDPWSQNLRNDLDRGDMLNRSASKKAEADWSEFQRLDDRAHDPARASRDDLWNEATDHARAAAVTAARIERGPRQVAMWLQIPRDLRTTFTAALDAASQLETALARRIAPTDPEKRAADAPSASAEGPTTGKDGPSR